MWNVASKSLVGTCIGHTNGVMAVAAMPDGQRILSGGHDHSVRVWLLDGTHVNTFAELAPSRSRPRCMPDNQHALCGSLGGVHLFNVNDGAVLRSFKHHNTVAPWPCCPTASASSAVTKREPASPTTASPLAEGTCADAADAEAHCGAWAGAGECARNAAFMRLKCRRSCGMCTV